MAKGKGGFLGHDGLNAPDAPTIGTASVASDTSLSIAFTAPSDTGGSAITEYLASARDSAGNVIGASGSSSPITITGLTTDTSYTITVIAKNAFGSSVPSEASNSAAPAIQGQDEYTTAGTYSWTAPTGVTSVSVVAVGAGGAGGRQGLSGFETPNGGGGGGLGYINNHSVTPGTSYTVVVGVQGNAAATPTTDGGDSYFDTSSTVKGNGGQSGRGGTSNGGGYTGDGGGNGGNGGSGSGASYSGGGGGAGGYSGNGGSGGSDGSAGSGGSGGAAGGGGGRSGADFGAGGGGGVGIYGEGTSGGASAAPSSTLTGSGGRGGSGGNNGSDANQSGNGSNGGLYGGGGGGCTRSNGYSGFGRGGAVRIIWGNNRSFPSTNTADV